MPALIRADILALRTVRSGWAVFLGTLLVTAVRISAVYRRSASMD